MKKTKIWVSVAVCLMVSVIVSGCNFFGNKKVETPKDNKKKTEAPAEPSASAEATMSREAAMEKAADVMKKMTIEEKVGQIFIVNLEQLDDSHGDFFEHRKFTKKMKKSLEKYHVGGVIFFSKNIETRKQTKRLVNKLQENSQMPLFVTVDEEGGAVSRIACNPKMKVTSFPTIESIGATEDTEYIQNMAQTIGSEIKELGFNVDFAPVADVKTSKLNSEIGSRSFGSDPEKVSEDVTAFVKGLQEENISATLKHFPGQGSSTGNTHQNSVNIDSSITQLRDIDFKPFQAGIEAGADFVMVSHISVSKVTENVTPASMSELILRTILREELGFEGITITDAMDMSSIKDYYSAADAAYNSFKSGMDIILMPTNLKEAYTEILNKVNDGTITKERLDESVLRIMTLKYQRGIIK